jgi:hypothetical protein
MSTTIQAEPHIVIPEWMTPEQVASINRKFDRNPDGSNTRNEFFGRVANYRDFCGLSWCGMFLGIEKDGYTHS